MNLGIDRRAGMKKIRQTNENVCSVFAFFLWGERRNTQLIYSSSLLIIVKEMKENIMMEYLRTH